MKEEACSAEDHTFETATYQCLVWLVLGKRALECQLRFEVLGVDLLEAGGL